MRISDIPYRVRHSLATRGVIGSVGAARRKVVDRLLRTPAPAKQVVHPHPFDAEFGTDTGGSVYPRELRDGRGKKSIYNAGYYGTPPSMFLQALGRLNINFADFTFVDIGAGKGRVMLLASNFPFRRVIGVEFAQDVAAVATRNISLYHPASRLCEDVRCVPGDAAEFMFPPGPLVIFMWNPFVGLTFDRVVANLENSLRQDPREVYLIYLNPDCASRVDACSALQRLWECRLEMSEEDFAFFEVGGTTETCTAWISVPA